MAILDLHFDRKTTLTIEDYGAFIGSVLNLNMNFTVVSYSLEEKGVILRISVPDDKLNEVMDILKQNKIKIQRSTIRVNEDLCVHCGACISLCNIGALYFTEEKTRGFERTKCVGCKLCVDACPRAAITFE